MKTDVSAHTLTARFENTSTNLESITQALNKAGYTVGEAEELLE